jgi:hypothetical protein
VDRPDPTTSGGGSGRHIVLGRAIAVIVTAVVLGVLILRVGGGPGAGTIPAFHLPSTGVPTTTAPSPSSTTTTVSHAGVKVLVANASTTNGVAAGYSTALQHAGWTLLPPVTAKPPAEATSSVYYAVNMHSQADAVAAALGIPVSAVLPVSPATPVASTAGADVIVLIGSDLAAKTPPSTVPPSTTPTVPKTTTTTTKSSKAS